MVVSLNAPLLRQTINEKNADNLSVASLFLHLLTSIIYLMYGIAISQWPVILCNIAYMFMTLILLYLKYIFRNSNIVQQIENI